MADKRVDELTDIDALADADSFPVRDASATTELKEVTAAQINDYVDANRSAIDLATEVTGDLPVADGGTGASTAAGALANLNPLNTVAASGATQTLLMGVNDVTMDEACTFTFPTVGAGRHEFTLILRGAFTPTFPASVDWPSASAPTYAAPTEFSFATVDSGTTWLGVAAPGFG